MNNLKRFLVVMLVLCMSLSMFACTGTEDPTTTGSEPATTTTTAPQQTTTPTTTTQPDDGKVDYKVTVLYPDDTPVVGVWVVVCKDDLCYNPVMTDENGVATFRLDEYDNYKTKLNKAVEGYVFEDYIFFEAGSKEITIKLVAETAE